MTASLIGDIQSTVTNFASYCAAQALLLNEENRGFCGGTILNEYFILTAAHCMNHSRYIYIKLGNATATQQMLCKHVQQFIIAKQCLHSICVQGSLMCCRMTRMKLSTK